MVARTRSPDAKPDRQRAAAAAALNPTLVWETLKRVRAERVKLLASFDWFLWWRMSVRVCLG
jgi:hypothetical protein